MGVFTTIRLCVNFYLLRYVQLCTNYFTIFKQNTNFKIITLIKVKVTQIFSNNRLKAYLTLNLDVQNPSVRLH